MKQKEPNKQPASTWGIVLKVFIAVATAVASVFGISSCNSSF